jgi:hypothetical protein
VVFSNDNNIDERRELIREYENFLLRKNFDITKLRLTARKHLSNKSKRNNLENVGTLLVKNIKSKTKDDYKKDLRFYYMGDVQAVLEHETNIEEANARLFYDWTYCYTFKNPDAQKKENELSVEDAYQHIKSFFKEMPMINR